MDRRRRASRGAGGPSPSDSLRVALARSELRRQAAAAGALPPAPAPPGVQRPRPRAAGSLEEPVRDPAVKEPVRDPAVRAAREAFDGSRERADRALREALLARAVARGARRERASADPRTLLSAPSLRFVASRSGGSSAAEGAVERRDRLAERSRRRRSGAAPAAPDAPPPAAAFAARLRRRARRLLARGRAPRDRGEGSSDDSRLVACIVELAEALAAVDHGGEPDAELCRALVEEVGAAAQAAEEQGEPLVAGSNAEALLVQVAADCGVRKVVLKAALASAGGDALLRPTASGDAALAILGAGQ